MAATAPPAARESERVKVESWRFSVLVDAGYSPRVAELIAERIDIDLHRAVELVKNGCRPDIAGLILL